MPCSMLVVHQRDVADCRPEGSEPFFYYACGHCGTSFVRERSLAGHWKYACVCLVTEPRPRVACPVCQKVRDVSTVSKHLRFGCNTLNRDGGRPTVQWKPECSGCHKMLTPRVVDEHKVRGCPYQRMEKRLAERAAKKKSFALLNTNPIKVEK